MVNVYNIILLYENVKGVEIIMDSLTDTTKIIRVQSTSTLNEVFGAMKSLGLSHLTHLALMYDNIDENATQTLSYMPILNKYPIDEKKDKFFGKQFINLLNLLKHRAKNLRNIDLLTCNIYRAAHKNEIAQKENIFNLNIRYSLDMTGPLQKGGDWVLESDHVNIKNIYFTDNIQTYPHLLGVIDNFIILENGEYFSDVIPESGPREFSAWKHHIYFKYNDRDFQPWTQWNEKMNESGDAAYVKNISYSQNHFTIIDASGDAYIVDKARFLADTTDLSGIGIPAPLSSTDLSGTMPIKSMGISYGTNDKRFVYIDADNNLWSSSFSSADMQLSNFSHIDAANDYMFISNVDSSNNFYAIKTDNHITRFNELAPTSISDTSANFINFTPSGDSPFDKIAILDCSKDLNLVNDDDVTETIIGNIIHYEGNYDDMWLLDSGGVFSYWNGTDKSNVDISNNNGDTLEIISFTLSPFYIYLMTVDNRVYEVKIGDMEKVRDSDGGSRLKLDSSNNNYYEYDGNIFVPPISILADKSLKHVQHFKVFSDNALRSQSTFSHALYNPYGDTYQEHLMMGMDISLNGIVDILYPDYIWPPTDISGVIDLRDGNFEERTLAGNLTLPFLTDISRTEHDPARINIPEISVFNADSPSNANDTHLLFKVGRDTLSDLSENLFIKNPSSEQITNNSNLIFHPGPIIDGDASANINLRNIDISGLYFQQNDSGVESNTFPLFFSFKIPPFKSPFTYVYRAVDTRLGYGASGQEMQLGIMAFPNYSNSDLYTIEDDLYGEKVTGVLRIELHDVDDFDNLKIYKIKDSSSNDVERKKNLWIDGASPDEGKYKLIANIPIREIRDLDEDHYDFNLSGVEVENYDRFALTLVTNRQIYNHSYNDGSSNVVGSFERLINAVPILDTQVEHPRSVVTTKIGDFTPPSTDSDISKNNLHNFAGSTIQVKIRGGEEGTFKRHNRFTNTYEDLNDYYDISFNYEIYYYSHVDTDVSSTSLSPSNDNKLCLVKTINARNSSFTYEFTDEDVKDWYENATAGEDTHPDFLDISGILADSDKGFGCKGFLFNVKYDYKIRYQDSSGADFTEEEGQGNIYYLPQGTNNKTYLQDSFAPMKYTQFGKLSNPRVEFEDVSGSVRRLDRYKWETKQIVTMEDVESAVSQYNGGSGYDGGDENEKFFISVGRGLFHENGVNENAIKCQDKSVTVDVSDISDDAEEVHFSVGLEVAGDISTNSVPGLLMTIDLSSSKYNDISNVNGLKILEYYYDISGDGQIDAGDISGSISLKRTDDYVGNWNISGDAANNGVTPSFQVAVYENRFYKHIYDTMNINEVGGTFSFDLPNNEIYDFEKNIIGFHFYWGNNDGNVIQKLDAPYDYISYAESSRLENTVYFTIFGENGIRAPIKIPYNFEKIIIYVEFWDGIYPHPLTIDIFNQNKVTGNHLWQKNVSNIRVLLNNGNEISELLYNNTADSMTSSSKIRIYHDASFNVLFEPDKYYISFFWGRKPSDNKPALIDTLIKRFPLSNDNEVYADFPIDALSVPILSSGDMTNAIYAFYSKKDASNNYTENKNLLGVYYLNVAKDESEAGTALEIQSIDLVGSKKSFNLNAIGTVVLFDMNFNLPVSCDAETKLRMNNGGTADYIESSSPNTIRFGYTPVRDKDMGTPSLKIKKLDGKIYHTSHSLTNFIKDEYWGNRENLDGVNIISNRIDQNLDAKLDDNELSTFVEEQIMNNNL